MRPVSNFGRRGRAVSWRGSPSSFRRRATASAWSHPISSETLHGKGVEGVQQGAPPAARQARSRGEEALVEVRYQFKREVVRVPASLYTGRSRRRRRSEARRGCAQVGHARDMALPLSSAHLVDAEGPVEVVLQVVAARPHQLDRPATAFCAISAASATSPVVLRRRPEAPPARVSGSRSSRAAGRGHRRSPARAPSGSLQAPTNSAPSLSTRIMHVAAPSWRGRGTARSRRLQRCAGTLPGRGRVAVLAAPARPRRQAAHRHGPRGRSELPSPRAGLHLDLELVTASSAAQVFSASTTTPAAGCA